MWRAFKRATIWSRSRTTRGWRATKRFLRSVPWFVRAAVPLLLFVAGTLWAFEAAGLLDVTGKDSSGTRFTAVLAPVGVLVTAAIGFLGHTINRQGEARQAVDSSIRAIALFAKPDGSPAEPLTAGAGLLALANLGQLDLAISLLSDLWGRNRVSREAAITLIDLGLNSRDPTIQIDASYALHTNSERLWEFQPSGRLKGSDDGAFGAASSTEASRLRRLTERFTRSFLPRCAARPEDTQAPDPTYTYPTAVFLRWDDSLPFEAKTKLAEAWVYLWTSAPDVVGYRLPTLVIGLQEIWCMETSPAIRNSVGLLLESALSVPGIPNPD
jgi:hypothetical protein